MSGDTLLDDPLFFPDTHRLSLEGNDADHFDADAWDDEVLDVIDKAHQTHALNRSVHYFLEYHKQEFLELLERQVNLIKTRSPVLKHNRITIYDKALLNLTRSGRDLDEPAAVVVFCEEYLGVSIGGAHQPAEVTNALGRAIELRNAVIRDAPDHATSYQRSPAPEPEQPARLGEGQTHMQVVDAQVTRLWQVYEQAKADFYAVPNREGQELTDAAKFLRDTAENALQYLADKDVDPDAMAELQSTFNMAKATVVSLTGGRKRKFDIVDQLQPAPRGPEADIEMQIVPYGFETIDALPPPPAAATAAAAEYAPSYRRRRFDPREEAVNFNNREMSEIADQNYHHFQKSSDSGYGAASGGGRYPSYGGGGSEWERGRDRHRSHRHGHGHGRGEREREKEKERSRSRRHKDRAAWEGGRERERGREHERDHYHHSHHHHHHRSHRRSRSEEEDKYWRRVETPPYDRHRSRERAGPYHSKREVDSYKPSRK